MALSSAQNRQQQACAQPLALWLVPVPELGGVARHVLDVAARGLPGYRLAVLAPRGALTKQLQELGVKVVEAAFGTQAGFVRSCWSLHRAIRQLQPAVIHSHLAYADFVAVSVHTLHRLRAVGKRQGQLAQLVTTEHGIAGSGSIYQGSWLKAELRALAHRLRLRLTDQKIAVSQSTARQMQRRWGARGVEVIYNGVDVAAVQNRVAAQEQDRAGQQAGPRVLSLARLAPEKGLMYLLEAFARLRQDYYPQARLEFAGSGPLLAALQKRVEALGLAEAVTFSGFVDAAAAMARSDILVQLSAWENCSYTLLDAKAAGLAVLASRVGGNPEILTDAELLAGPGQLPAEEAAVTAARRIAERYGQIQQGQQDFQWPSIARMNQKIADVYVKGG